MADAHGMSVQVRLAGVAASANGTPAAGERAEFAASGKVITFPGFLRAYVEGADDPEAELEDREVHLPRLAADDAVDQEALEARSHATQPPSRYTEASLVKALEELGVGRPSTYATIISTIQDRGYVWKKGSALVPSFIAFAVVGLLERHFTDLVDYGFTASMEDDLDEIADGQEEAIPWLSRFYFGNGKPGLKATVSGHLDEIDAREVNSIPIGLDGGGEQIMLRVGRYGPYVQRGEDRASVPDDVAPDELTVERAKELLAAPSGDRVLGQDPSSGLPVLVRAGRYGPYVQLGEGDPGSKTKPRTSSLFQTMSPDTLSLDDALRLLSLPRVVGTDPSDGAEILALNGRFGPYLKKGDDSRSLSAEEQLFSVTLDEALAIFAQPKQRGGRRAAAAPLRELGEDPTTGGSMVLRSGRFGPYVTDGEVNASLRRGDDPDSLTPERAAELLAEKRAAGPAPPRKSARARRSTKAAKKASTKKAAASTNSAGASRAGAKKAGTKKAAATKKKATARKTGGATGRTATRTRS